MKITCLLENTASRSDVTPEHGLSLWIETKRHRILFDTGQTDLFAKNADVLQIDLSKADFAVLSHGHYDHGGGLFTFLSKNKTAPVFTSGAISFYLVCLGECYEKHFCLPKGKSPGSCQPFPSTAI